MFSTETKYVFNVFPNLFVSFSRFSGVFPLDSNLKPSKIAVAYSVLLTLVCKIVQISSPYVVFSFDNCCTLENPSLPVLAILNKSSMLTKFIRSCFPIVMASAPCVSILNSLWKYKYNLLNYMKYLNKSDKLLKNNKLFYDKQRLFAIIFTSCSLGIDIGVKSISLATLALADTFEDSIFYWIVLLFFIDVIGFVAEIQFILMSNALKIRYQEINQRLRDIFSIHGLKLEYKIKLFCDKWKMENYINETPKDLGTDNTKDKSKKGILHFDASNLTTVYVLPHEHTSKKPADQLNYLYFDGGLVNQYKESDIEEMDFSPQLHLLRMSHRNLSKAFDIENKMFEFMLLNSIFTRFLMILGNSYFAIFGFEKVFILSHRWDVVFWLFKCLFRFVAQLVVSDLLSKEANLAVQILSFSASHTLSRRTKEELEYFRREVNSRNLVVTSAFNLFILKRELITAALAASATYIVTLVQLH